MNSSAQRWQGFEFFSKWSIEETCTNSFYSSHKAQPWCKRKVSADASAYGIGAVFIQQNPTSIVWKSVANAFHAMSGMLCGSFEKFSDCIFSKWIHLKTDHKPLDSLFSTAHLDRILPNILQLHQQLTWFDYSIEYVPEKSHFTTASLSRALDKCTSITEEYPYAEFLANAVVTYLTDDPDWLHFYFRGREKDPACLQMHKFCKTSCQYVHTMKGNLAP